MLTILSIRQIWFTFDLMNRSVFFVFFLLCLAFQIQAQQFPGSTTIPGTFGQSTRPGSSTGSSNSPNGIDDSTKVIYGPTSTRYMLEDDILNNRRKLYTMDTTMDEVHRFLYVQRSQNQYQDLGNLGTPMKPVFVQVPQQLGVQSGYSAFSPYAYQTMQVKYFDTKSPFTDMYLALGGRNQNILRFDFTQNIKPHWNVGFNAQRFSSQKQFGTSGSNDPTKLLAQNWGFLAHTNYRSKDDKYTLLMHFINMNHSLDEQGGVLPGQNIDGTPIEYDYVGDSRLRSGSTSIQGPHGTEIQNNWHVYHQYILEKGLQVYHRLDYRIQRNSYHDDTLSLNQSITYPDGTVRRFYPSILGDTSKISQDNRFRVLENQFGLKGVAQYKEASFNYRAYLRIRNYKQHARYNTSRTVLNEYDVPGIETFLGGWVGYYFPDSLSRLTAEAEYQVAGGYRLQGQFESKFLTAGYSSIFANPTSLQDRYQSHIFFWRNNFSLRGYQHAYGQLNVRYKKLRLQPGLDYYLLSNYVYFDENAQVQQADGSFSVFRTGLGYHIEAGKFVASGQAYYTVQSRTDILRTPPFFMNARFQYEFLYAKVLYIQVGVDLHYKQSYYADAYMPVTQQFYLQNTKPVEGYVLADLYANLRINRTRLFVKLTHANQGVFQPGYFVAPDYLQMRRGFAFGVDWYLFD